MALVVLCYLYLYISYTIELRVKWKIYIRNWSGIDVISLIFDV